MRRARDLSVTLGLLALGLAGPTALAAFVLSRDAQPSHPMLAAVAGAAPSAESRAGSRSGDVLSGMLYTRGSATVDWQGARIPVDDGSYAYLGGELIRTAPNSIGTLELVDGDVIYICPSSRVSLERGPGREYRLFVREGTARYVFGPDTPFSVRANQGLVTPVGGAPGGPVVGEITVFPNHPGGVICNFADTVEVAGFAAGDEAAPIALGSAGAGEIVDLARALRTEQANGGSPVVMQPIPMPSAVSAWLRRNAGPSRSGSFIGYLCRCEELKRYADAEGIPDTAIAPRLTPPQGDRLPLSDPGPKLGPPTAPAVTLVAPGPPDPADPGVLPTPATGRPAPGPVIPAPAVPVGGSGGGFTTTPS